MGARPVLALGDEPLTVDGVGALAAGRVRPAFVEAARQRMQASYDVVQRELAAGETIYGVTTGVGASVDTQVHPDEVAGFSMNLLRMHGCGTGRVLDDEESAAVLAVRLGSLARGASGIRPVVADHLTTMLDKRVLPRIPAEGSVGASGDLTPLSYVAATLAGEREVTFRGQTLDASTALREVGLEALQLGPKEALSLMNGTSVATALGCLAWLRARRLARVASAITAMASEALRGNPAHFDAFIHAAKPHPGQMAVARWVREDLGADAAGGDPPARLQDRYSVRCAPHVIGVLVDVLTWTRGILETELNGVSDNPIVDTERGAILHGGNFYGGHVGFAFDALKTAVANVADLLDRQLMLLTSPHENAGLPANLSGGGTSHHGFKAMSISASALTAEALKLTIPASIFSRSTEGHNQDKVPMATIAARDTLRIATLTEQVTAISLLATTQALDLRGLRGGNGVAEMHAAVRERVAPVDVDRRMDGDIVAAVGLIREGALPLDEALPGEARA